MTTLWKSQDLVQERREALRIRLESLRIKRKREVCLGLILVGNDAASQVYVAHKKKACEAVGIQSKIYRLNEDCTQEQLLKLVHELNANPEIDGFILQLPLPEHLDSEAILLEIDPDKDVDGFHPYNLGRMVQGLHGEDLAPCTPKGITRIFEYFKYDLTGKNVVVLGRSNIVGKPMANLLINRSATVTVLHSKSQDIEKYCLRADVIIVAIGKPKFLKRSMVKEGAVIIDVGIHRDGEGLCGDVDIQKMMDYASAITPVPGGVGPMTVMTLLENTVTSAEKSIII